MSRHSLEACLLVALCAIGAPAAFGQAQDQSPDTAQPATPPPAAELQSPGIIQGTILSAATGQPLRRAQALLRPADSKGTALYQTTDESGAFSFPNVAPGRYIITAEREGYLPLSAASIGDYKMPPIFSVSSGQTVGSLVFRMTPSCVISGKVKFDDAEPAANVTIQLYRSRWERGRHTYAAAGNTRTDDRGEYRVHSLEPGSYYVAALYQAPPRPPDAQEETRKDVLGNPLPELSYAVTFFPQVQRMADAAVVNVAPGNEVGGIDIFLSLVHTVHVRGRVVSALKGGTVVSPGVTLRWNDPDNTASVTAPISVSFDKDQNFDIRGVTSGPYLLLATGGEDGVTLTGRLPINIGDSDIENADLVIGAESLWTGKVHIDDDDTNLPDGLMISLQPRRSTALAARAEVSKEGDFTIPFTADETYDLYVMNGPDNSYLKSVRVANADRLAQGLEAAPGSAPAALDVRLSSQGGQIPGRAVTADPKVVATGASIALLPDPAAGRVQAYQTTQADEYGNFLLKGVPPGKYVVVAWLDSAPCEIYNPDDLTSCEAQGASVTLAEGAQTSIQVTAR